MAPVGNLLLPGGIDGLCCGPLRASNWQNQFLTTMCLAIPGQIIDIKGEDDPLQRMGRVQFGGIVKEVNLAYTPQATVDDYVLVHVGFALSIVDADEALKVFEYLDEMQELAELDETG